MPRKRRSYPAEEAKVRWRRFARKRRWRIYDVHPNLTTGRSRLGVLAGFSGNHERKRPLGKPVTERRSEARHRAIFYPRPSVVEPRPESRDGRSHPRPAQHRTAMPRGLDRALVGRWMDFYDRRRPHSSLNDRTPDEAYTDDGADRSPGLRPVSCQHDPGFHLSCDQYLSKGWGPPQTSMSSGSSRISGDNRQRAYPAIR